MKQIGSSQSSQGCKRIFYADNEGRLVSKLLHDHDQHAAVTDSNQQEALDYRAHGQSDLRKIAEIPVDLYLKWLIEDGVPGYMDSEALDSVLNKRLRDPDNKYLLTVPSTYRMMRNG